MKTSDVYTIDSGSVYFLSLKTPVGGYGTHSRWKRLSQAVKVAKKWANDCDNDRSYVEVYNRFGQVVRTFNHKGLCIQSAHDRKDIGDRSEEAAPWQFAQGHADALAS